jgi:hypothetical protein
VPEGLKKTPPRGLLKKLSGQRMKRGESAEGGKRRPMRLEGRMRERHAEQRGGNVRLRKRESVRLQMLGMLSVQRGGGFVSLRKKLLLMTVNLIE